MNTPNAPNRSLLTTGSCAQPWGPGPTFRGSIWLAACHLESEAHHFRVAVAEYHGNYHSLKEVNGISMDHRIKHTHTQKKKV